MVLTLNKNFFKKGEWFVAKEIRIWAACRAPLTSDIKQGMQDSVESIEIQARNRSQMFTAML